MPCTKSQFTERVLYFRYLPQRYQTCVPFPLHGPRINNAVFGNHKCFTGACVVLKVCLDSGERFSIIRSGPFRVSCSFGETCLSARLRNRLVRGTFAKTLLLTSIPYSRTEETGSARPDRSDGHPVSPVFTSSSRFCFFFALTSRGQERPGFIQTRAGFTTGFNRV